MQEMRLLSSRCDMARYVYTFIFYRQSVECTGACQFISGRLLFSILSLGGAVHGKRFCDAFFSFVVCVLPEAKEVEQIQSKTVFLFIDKNGI